MIRYLVSLALAEMGWRAAAGSPLPVGPQERAILARIWDGIPLTEPSPQDLAEVRRRAWSLVAEEVARIVADGWDRYGAPTVAAYAKDSYFAHYEGPNGERILEASSKREAYRKARRAWIKEILKGS